MIRGGQSGGGEEDAGQRRRADHGEAHVAKQSSEADHRPHYNDRMRRAVIFDAGNTLLRMNYRAIAVHLAERGRRVTAVDVEDAELRGHVRLDAHPDTAGSTESAGTRDRYVRFLLEPLGITDDAEINAVGRWRASFELAVGPVDRGRPGRRRRAPPRQGGRADGRRDLQLQRAGRRHPGRGRARRHLDFVIDSSEVGVEKPDARIFALALARAGVEPAEAVYVGDLYSVDVRGARAAGVDGILLDPGGHWGRRDCRLAPGPLAAVRLALGR